MTKETILLLSAILSSPLIGMWIKSMFERTKIGAETHNLNISGEISIGDAWKKYAEKMEERLNELNVRFEILEENFALLKLDRDRLIAENRVKEALNKKLSLENASLVKENADYKKRIGDLELRVVELEKSLEAYKHKEN